MGWCSATRIFDSVAGVLLDDGVKDTEEVLTQLIAVLEDGDWDCQTDSQYYEHPIVQEIMKDLHPRWFEEE